MAKHSQSAAQSAGGQDQAMMMQRESLSALMDGEASDLELRRLLKSSDESVRVTWSRYQAISAVMKREEVGFPAMDLSAAIRDAIDEEPALSQSRQNWWSGASRLAVAASVAAVMVVSAQFVMNAPDDEAVVASRDGLQVAPVASSDDRLLQQGAAPMMPAGFDASVSARTVSAQSSGLSYAPVAAVRAPSVIRAGVPLQDARPPQDVQLYLQSVMEKHAGTAAFSTGHGMLPYARAPLADD